MSNSLDLFNCLDYKFISKRKNHSHGTLHWTWTFFTGLICWVHDYCFGGYLFSIKKLHRESNCCVVEFYVLIRGGKSMLNFYVLITVPFPYPYPIFQNKPVPVPFPYHNFEKNSLYVPFPYPDFKNKPVPVTFPYL